MIFFELEIFFVFLFFTRKNLTVHCQNNINLSLNDSLKRFFEFYLGSSAGNNFFLSKKPQIISINGISSSVLSSHNQYSN